MSSLSWDDAHVWIKVGAVQIGLEQADFQGLLTEYLKTHELRTVRSFDESEAVVRERFRAELAKHRQADCSTCGRRAHRIRRNVHREMAVFLVELVKIANEREAGEWTHARDILGPEATKASTDAAYFTHFGLVERKSQGLYRPTAAGWAWVRGERTIWSHFYTFNNQVDDFDGRRISVQDALGCQPTVDGDFVADPQGTLFGSGGEQDG